MKVLTITLYMLGAILILPHQVCSMEIEEQRSKSSSTSNSSSQRLNTNSIKQDQKNQDTITARLTTTLRTYSDPQLTEPLIKLSPDHLSNIEYAFHGLCSKESTTYNISLIRALSNTPYIEMGQQQLIKFINAAIQVTNVIDKLRRKAPRIHFEEATRIHFEEETLHYTRDTAINAKIILINAIGSVRPLYLGAVVDAFETFYIRLGLDSTESTEDNIPIAQFLFMAGNNISVVKYLFTTIAKKVKQGRKSLKDLQKYFSIARINVFYGSNLGWKANSIIKLFDEDSGFWEKCYQEAENAQKQNDRNETLRKLNEEKTCCFFFC